MKKGEAFALFIFYPSEKGVRAILRPPNAGEFDMFFCVKPFLSVNHIREVIFLCLSEPTSR